MWSVDYLELIQWILVDQQCIVSTFSFDWRMNFIWKCYIQVLTNGKYKSIEHRALTNRNKERLSVVMFHAPSYNVEIGPFPQLIDEAHPRLYRSYKHTDYNRHYLSNKLEGKKMLDFTKIHP